MYAEYWTYPRFCPLRALNDIGYEGPVSIEWEDSGMDREHGAKEGCDFVRALQFPKTHRAFDAAFERP